MKRLQLSSNINSSNKFAKPFNKEYIPVKDKNLTTIKAWINEKKSILMVELNKKEIHYAIELVKHIQNHKEKIK